MDYVVTEKGRQAGVNVDEDGQTARARNGDRLNAVWLCEQGYLEQGWVEP